MLKIKTLHRAAAGDAKRYYVDQKDDYYSKEGASQWHGKGAAALGLQGEVAPEDFVGALRGELAGKLSMPATTRKDSKARAGMDFTFSAPKSVTLQALLGGDSRVVTAHDRAVASALTEAENYAATRGKTKGKVHRERTMNLVAATFRHETARPTKNSLPDPQLHTHAIIMNITQRSDGSWRALDNSALYEMKRYIDAVYVSELAKEMRQLGYDVRFNKDGSFDLAHVSRDQIEAFSKRSAGLEAALRAEGLTRATASSNKKQTLILKTRLGKDLEIGRDDLRKEWMKQAQAVGLHFDAQTGTLLQKGGRAEAQLEGKAHSTVSALEAPSLAELANEVTGRQETLLQRFLRAFGLTDDTLFTSHAAASDGMPMGSSQHTALSTAAGGQRTPAMPGIQRASVEPGEVAAEAAVRWALRHLTERESIVEDEDLRVKALTHAAGRASATQISSAISSLMGRGMLVARTTTYRPAANARETPGLTAAGWMEQIRQQGRSAQAAEALVTNAVEEGRLVPDGRRYTTPQARRRELSVLRVEHEGRESVKPILSEAGTQAVLNNEELSPGQRQAAELMLTTSNRVVGVQGLAGTGKSHMLKPTLKAMEAAGYRVQTVASYGAQVRALRDLGVESSTIASMLGATTAGRFALDEKTVLVVDEAGVVPARLMDKLLIAAERANARVVLIGDTGQTKAIEAGRPFDQLQGAGMTTALMGEIKRQIDPVLLEAVVLASQGQAHDSLKKVTNVHQVKDKTSRWDAIATDFADREVATRDNTLIVTGTNESRRAINDLVRVKLGLEGTGRQYTLLRRRDTTQAERRHAKYYVRGDIIQPERDYASGLKRGTMYTILGQGEGNRLKVMSDDGAHIEFDPRRTLKLSVYEPESAELAVGDWIRITRNDAALDLATGNRFQVTAMDDATITLTSPDREVKLPATERLHVDLAYATTVHGSQGLTTDHVLFHADSKSRTTSKEVYYVAISRARHTAQIFTDDASKLPIAVMRAAEKGTALEETQFS